MAEKITIFEMSPRDGLQNETRLIPAAQKIELVDRLTDCGFAKIEVTSFVNPKWVPQMADAAEVMAKIRRKPGTVYAALTPNLQGYSGAKSAAADEVAIFGSASESFSQKNINCSIAESLGRFQPVAEVALADGIPVRGYVSCATDCPYEGSINPEAVADVAEKLLAMGCYEVCLADTIGAGTPMSIGRMLDAVLTRIPANRLAGHYHDTNGRALANIEVSLEKGLRVFDASAGGLGGCPYAPGAKGNVDSYLVAKLIHARGCETGLDLEKLRATGLFAASLRSES